MIRLTQDLTQHISGVSLAVKIAWPAETLAGVSQRGVRLGEVIKTPRPLWAVITDSNSNYQESGLRP